MDTANLESVEILKGPASLLSGEGATGGAINFVNKQPTSGPVQNEAFFSLEFAEFVPQFLWLRRQHQCAGIGLSLRHQPLLAQRLHRRYRYQDVQRLRPAQLSSVSENLKVWGAIEYKQDYSNAYWGTPLVSTAFSGPNATHGIVSGTYVSNFNGTNLGPVTIDNRTLTTNYNVARQ